MVIHRSESYEGNLQELHQGPAGDVDFRWQARFGGVARYKAPFGVCFVCFGRASDSQVSCMYHQADTLWISDPKALQYIYQTSGYNFPKQPERRALSRLIGDHGLTWADGNLLVIECFACSLMGCR